ncbi:hypothetical protein M406DRAFT_346466 [Cryphonectria parasitica EP155]|uniref:Zn(2)-C6 fungal-type domain-containing protein n=1 Tax=Cryphonectria parasitica (strain ATCC 38755 / EP155) TaxID=660469 RepID=A0A9P4Y0B9_CRYP1|nr:uncharacterized protein M406DRAFT_346466 [Cryphonectria parasitica EP155]KAF3764216.1 hypothetical protein M406DRAFT_346466 [Cryphonectria parasitica EP155]
MPSKRKATATSATSEADNATDSSPANTNTSAPVKRQRVSRACDQCRAAREKCDGIQPLCFPCVSQNRPCTYAANPKKRGVQTGYIKTLEVALAWLFEKVPGCEDALDNLLMHEGGQGQNLLVGKDSDKANRLHKRWRRSKVHKEIDRILSGGDVAQSRVDKSSPSEDGESDNEQNEETPQTLSKSNPLQRQLQSAGGPLLRCADGYTPSDAQLDYVIKLPSNHWRLVDIYFSYTHCWYPILEKQDLLKTIYLYPENGLDIRQMGNASASHAELWAAMALASHQDASSLRMSTTGVTESTTLSSDDIYNIARRLVPSEEGDFEIQHTRALLLLALINVGKGKKTSAWILVGLAHRIALDVSELHSGEERSSRQATAVLMGCYILDTLISVHRRGMPSLDTAGISEGMSIPEDNLDEWQPWAPCEGFGPTPGARMSSRSPAYSLTTFNQIYDVFKFMRKRTMQRQNGLLSGEHPSEAMMLLHQTIKPRLPFASFIISRDSSSVSIPSAYVLRILFLWVGAILDSVDASPCGLILESVEQYLAQFGACGAPPFFSSCLAMMRQHPSFNDLHPQGKERWQMTQDTLASIWTTPTTKPPRTVPPVPALSKTTATAETPLAAASAHTAPTVSTSTPPDLMPMLNTQSIMHSGPGPPLQQGQRMPPTRTLVHRESFNAGPLDYDALLDDLSSMDYLDRVDADPQFMANLGFAPGCDISEVLSHEFGAI